MRKQVAYLMEFVTDHRGSMTVEFVAFAPLLIAALVVSFEFGRAFWAFDVVTRDVRAGVRYLARNSATPPPYGANLCPATARNVVETGLPNGVDANKHFPWKTNPAATFSCPSQTFDDLCPLLNDCGLNDDGNVITMAATVQVSLSLMDVVNRLAGLTGAARIDITYPLTVTYQTRYVGN
jgi:hypothetical protein